MQRARSLPFWAQDEPGDLESNYLTTSSSSWDCSWAGVMTVSQNAQVNTAIVAGCLRLSRSHQTYRLQKKFPCPEISRRINISFLPFSWLFSLNTLTEIVTKYFICKEQGNKSGLTWVPSIFYYSREYGENLCMTGQEIFRVLATTGIVMIRSLDLCSLNKYIANELL